MTVLHDSVQLIRKAEGLVIGKVVRSSSRLWGEILDSVINGPWFILSGAEALVPVLVRGALAGLIWAGLLLLLSNIYGPEISWSSLFVGATLLATGSVVLGLPSGLAARSVKEADTQELAKEIVTLAGSTQKLELLRRGIEQSDGDAQRRASSLRWGLGVMWALIVWVLGNWVFDTEVSDTVRDAVLAYSFVATLFFLLVGAAVACYQLAQNKLRQTIAFSFLEAEALLLPHEPTESTG